jgi:putative ATP-dependent endonuclease of OLD family
MFIERLILTNFRCFGPQSRSIDLALGLTTFVGVNGAGKTAVMQALLRLFGVTGDQRRLRRQDFHIPVAEDGPVLQRSFVIEAIIAFPELDSEESDDAAIPEFFNHMAADEEGKLKCRLRLQATWTDDGSLDGAKTRLGLFEQFCGVL